MSHPYSLSAGAPTCSRVGQLGDFNVGWSRISMCAGMNARHTGDTRQSPAFSCERVTYRVVAKRSQ
jgi:hypothetical protein